MRHLRAVTLKRKAKQNRTVTAARHFFERYIIKRIEILFGANRENAPAATPSRHPFRKKSKEIPDGRRRPVFF